MAPDTAGPPPDTLPYFDFDTAIEFALLRVHDDRLRIILQMAHASLDMSAVEEIHWGLEALPEDSKLKGGLNILGLPRHWAVAAAQIAALDLDRLPRQRVLGLGRAAGHFLFCAKALHHDVTAAYQKHDVYDRLIKLYGIPCFPQSKGSELPDGQFHLIVAGNVLQGDEEGWVNFLNPLDDCLADHGRIFLTLFKQPAPVRNYDPDAALSTFERMGGQVSRPDYSVVLEKGQIERRRAPTPAVSQDIASVASPAEDVAPDIGQGLKPSTAAATRSHRIAAGAVALLAAIAIFGAMFWASR